MSRFLLGVTGASGAIYAARLLHYLHEFGHSVSLLVTEAGREVAEFEGFAAALKEADEELALKDYFCHAASGSSDFAGMAVAPCSMGTLGKIASGVSDSLLIRAADVALKERRPLVLLVREMPYQLIHLENMERVTRAGAIVIPASPHFYAHPKSVEALADTVVAKVLTHLGVRNEIVPKWGSRV